MTDRRWDNGSPSFNKDRFRDFLTTFGPVKKFTCFFDNTNFLMTPYTLMDDNIHAVLENEAGDTLQFSDLLCGYRGQGSRSTIGALDVLGIPPKDAENFCRKEQGFRISFPYTGKIDNEVWFHNVFTHPVIEINPHNPNFFRSLNRRVLIFMYPEINSIPTVLSCFHVMKPFSFRYSLDKSAPLIAHRELSVSGLLSCVSPRMEQNLRDVNLVIRGELFDIYCCISDIALRGTLNTFYLYLTGETLFCENNINGLTYYSESGKSEVSVWKMIRSLFKKRNKEPQATVQLEVHNLRRELR